MGIKPVVTASPQHLLVQVLSCRDLYTRRSPLEGSQRVTRHGKKQQNASLRVRR